MQLTFYENLFLLTLTVVLVGILFLGVGIWELKKKKPKIH